MTTKPVRHSTEVGRIVRFPDAPPEEMTAYHHVNFPGYPGFLALHFGNPETTVILSEIAAGLFETSSREGIRFPDLLIAFDARPDLIIPRNGYLIPEQGKPPDFVLEVASETTGRIDENEKRRDYARFRVPEYWRFDHTGGDFHSTHLAGDRFVGEEYQPILVHHTPEGHHWGHSDALNLDLCWENGVLRWYDPIARRYLVTRPEEREARLDAETRGRDAETRARDAEARAHDAETRARDAEARARDAETRGRDAEARTRDAETRADQLKQELRRLRGE